jgi:DNA-directed RNA polymerase subunit M/transcription elongation factor TFIIS
MGAIPQAGEWLRLAELYRQMADGELVAIARDRSKLTEIAQQILALELSHRNLKVEPETPPLEPRWQPPASGKQGESLDADDPYAEDRQLFDICTVWSLRDALEVQRRLETADIPFFIGEKQATGVDPGTTNFANGVSVQIMRVGFPWARQALEDWEPKDVPESEKRQWTEEVDVRCPACHSKEIIFEKLVKSDDGNPPPKFQWTCAVCGHQWQDDGVAS